MLARSMIIGLVTVAGFAAAHADGAPPTGFDFNRSGTSGWLPSDPLADAFGATTFSNLGGRYTVTSAQLPPLPIFVGAGVGLIDSNDNRAWFRDGAVRATIRLHNPATNAFLGIRTNAGATVGYDFFLNNVENIIGVDELGSVGGNIEAVPFDLTEGVDYRIEGRADGDLLSIKVWVAGEDEPAEPQISVQSKKFAEPGLVNFVVYNQPSNAGGSGGVLSADMDDFTFTPIGWSLLDDFATSAMDSWTVIDYTKDAIAQVAAVSGVAQISTPQPVTGAGSVYLALNDSTADPARYADGTIRMIARAGNRDCALNLGARLDDTGLTGIAGGFFPATGQVIVGEAVNNQTTIFDSAVVSVAGLQDADWYLEFEYRGDRLSMKVWPVGQPEPSEAQVNSAGATVTAAGRLVVGTERARGTGRIDAAVGDAWFRPVACRGDFNADGTLNSQDFFDFLASFFAGSPGADFNHDGALNSQDFFDFLGAFFAGCA